VGGAVVFAGVAFIIWASGNRMVYVDTNGDFMKCPFCHKKSGSLLDENFESMINEMNVDSCSDFGSFG
jgi:hypothetical protein